MLAELVARGGHVASLARLARHDRAVLSEELKALGLSKLGVRLQTQAALLDEGLDDEVMPSVQSALRRSKDEKELEALLKLANFSEFQIETQLPLLHAAGVTVRVMQAIIVESDVQ